MKDMNRRHEQELKAMQQKIHMNTDAAFNKFKEAAQQIMSQKLAQPITNKQVRASINTLLKIIKSIKNCIKSVIDLHENLEFIYYMNSRFSYKSITLLNVQSRTKINSTKLISHRL